jgi:1-acyl-sn-glycerol-3-phosphate acyltransferase
MRAVTACWRVARSVLHVVHGLLIVVLRFHVLDARQRMLRVQWWSEKLLRLLGITLKAEGTPGPGAKLLVANHISWLDIVVINAVVPARFVSKSEVRHWPVIGRLVDAAGTLYIERERRRDAVRVVHQMADALKAGDTLAVFPEGTTTDGHSLLPFHANLLQAAIATQSPVQPVALRFSDAARRVSTAVAYIGDTSLLQSLLMVVTAEQLTAHVHLLAAEPTEHVDRRSVSQRVRESIAARLNAD